MSAGWGTGSTGPAMDEMEGGETGPGDKGSSDPKDMDEIRRQLAELQTRISKL